MFEWCIRPDYTHWDHSHITLHFQSCMIWQGYQFVFVFNSSLNDAYSNNSSPLMGLLIPMVLINKLNKCAPKHFMNIYLLLPACYQVFYLNVNILHFSSSLNITEVMFYTCLLTFIICNNMLHKSTKLLQRHHA